MSDIRVWQITPTENIKLEIDASSLDEITQQLPAGYYSTFRTFGSGTRILGLTSHLQRLYQPVSNTEVDESVLRRRLSALLESYYPGEARVRTVMTSRGKVYIAIAPLSPLPREVYEQGVRVETIELQREHPRLKSTSFISRSDSERKHIAQEGIFEALLVTDGTILEGMTSNFFYVGQLSNLPCLGTARHGILLGITRETVLEIAQGRGLAVNYQPLKLAQIEDISEAFITSSSRGIVPVIQIDEVTIGQGSPGPITKELWAAYEAHVLEIAERI
ncbi:MAG TPA: aminotransferase class IV [Anaerolineales bacterium]|nr:aminotransferase class IV [Anaerolineales bacterium]